MNISLESMYLEMSVWTEYEWLVPQVTIEDIRKGISESTCECEIGYIGESYKSSYSEKIIRPSFGIIIKK